jgi:cytochrome c2
MVLATALWNHSPTMWRAQQQREIRPMLDSMETADLFAYFFSLAYFTTPGDANRGALLFDQKTCSRCHAVALDSRITTAHKPRLQTAPPISTWSGVSDPLVWAERMWNHSGTVYADLANNGVAWPQFSTADMLDLLAYLRSVPESPSPLVNFQLGDPEFGRLVFESSCESCHSFGNKTVEHKIDLARRPAPDLLTGYITAMWNHAPFMREVAGPKFPVLQPGDMSNLVAYLFAQRYFDEEGDPERGARVFESKRCVVCHELNRQETQAPDLAMATERFSPVTLGAAVWTHGPAMLKMMQKQNIDWPTFKGSEMPDLIAFLNKRLVIRVGKQ